MKTTEQVLEYAQSVHLALTGTPIPLESDSSDHPYSGCHIDTILDMVDGDLVKSQIKEFEKDLKSEMDAMFANLEIGTPVKVTKGSKDKRGMEGFIIYAKDPMHGSGKALFVYDVLTHQSCMVRDSATKVRLPKPGERAFLRETYRVCEDLAPHFTVGNNVKLKANPNKTGFITKTASLNPNLDGHGFHEVQVQWNDDTVSSHILTEIDLIK